MKIKFYLKLESSSFEPNDRIYRVFGYRSSSSVKKLSEFVSDKDCIKLNFCEDLACKYLFFSIVVDNQLLSIFTLDDCEVAISERITIANIFCFSKFLKKTNPFENDKNESDKKENDKKEERDAYLIALGMRNNFIHLDGTISKVIQSNPNNLETNSYPLFNFLSTILHYTIFDIFFRLEFLVLVGHDNILDGFIWISQNPTQKVLELYFLGISRHPVFIPALNTISLPFGKKPIPDQWTLTLKFNQNGSENFIMGGPGYLVFDENNRVWINNNVRQGTPNSSTFCTILESNGKPADFSPLFGGGLLGAGFGIATSKSESNCRSERIAIGNFGWGSKDYNPQNGSVSVFKNNGSIKSPSNGSPENSEFKRAQGLYYDRHGRLWISVWGSQEPLGSRSDSTFDFENGNSGVAVLNQKNQLIDFFQFNNPFFGTFDLIVDQEENVFVSNAGNLEENVPSSVYHLRLINDKIIQINSWETLNPEGFRQINLSRAGFLYVSALIPSKVYKLDKDLNLLQTFTNLIDGPWGIVFDKEDRMYVSNFRRDSQRVNSETFDMDGKFGVTIIENDDENTAKLFTLPTGGDPVLLANGFPLYGSNSLPSYEPLMRLTGSQIDKAGNLWSLNNWKPSLINNFLKNPGGDGAVVFIGIAS